jgi:hypothetical protein
MDDGELVSERDDFQLQHGARPDQEAKGVKERDDDGRHDCRLSENACNLNRRHTYEVLGSNSCVACPSSGETDVSLSPVPRLLPKQRGASSCAWDHVVASPSGR